jgi:glycine/serine hydroxymethyltransferase
MVAAKASCFQNALRPGFRAYRQQVLAEVANKAKEWGRKFPLCSQSFNR